MGTAAGEMNLGALLPNIGTVVGLIEFALWLAILAGPLMLLGFGLLFRYRPPAEANFGLGYRFWWGMASLEAWRYTQRLAGIIWTILGVVLTPVMLVVCIILQCCGTMTLAIGAAVCLIIELVLVAAACITINVLVMKKYDKDGYLREETAE
ncbi:MAG: SdpI family protein [Ruminococcaceae bacterium]|nr:SdpI family protein [Oscillospiraceae bacterium]